MSDHVIQIRDLWEMLKPHGEDCEIVIKQHENVDTAPIVGVLAMADNRRRVALLCQGEDFAAQVEDLEEWKGEATKLLKRLIAVPDCIHDSDRQEEVDELVKSAEEFLNED